MLNCILLPSFSRFVIDTINSVLIGLRVNRACNFKSNYWLDYSLNFTPLSPITITYYVVSLGMKLPLRFAAMFGVLFGIGNNYYSKLSISRFNVKGYSTSGTIWTFRPVRIAIRRELLALSNIQVQVNKSLRKCRN